VKITLRFSKSILFLIGFFVLASPSFASAENVFNAIVLKKADLERRHGVTALECFPFLKNIGTQEDQVRWVESCLQGINTLTEALDRVPDAGLRTAGISTRFLRTGGFHTLLVPWDATAEAMAKALRENLSPQEQDRFLEKVKGVKREILGRFSIASLYCSQTISNEDCLKGYETLARVPSNDVLRNKNWAEVVVGDSHRPHKNPQVLTLKFSDSPETMADRLQNMKVHEVWSERKKVYEEIQERHGKEFKALQLPNFFCDRELTGEECRQGAAHLAQAASNETLRKKKWSEVMVHRHNTLIRNDYDVVMRYDLPSEEIVRIFSAKPDKKTVEAHVTRAEKLEKITKNNSTGLRAVCDLGDLPSGLCVQAFETFIEFLRKYRAFQVGRPWTDLMFVDGSQLSRVNFALNSKSRDTYLYIDAASDLEELQRYLGLFRK